MKTRIVTALVLVVALLSLAGGMPALARLQPRSALAPQGTGVSAEQAQNVEWVGQIGGYLGSVALQDSFAYVGLGPRLVVLDVSDPAHPTVAGETGIFPSIVEGLTVVGNYAYVADGDSGLHIVDVTHPAAPIETGSWDTPGTAYEVAVAGNYAYVADGELGLRIIDVSDPAVPSEAGYYDTPMYAHSVAVAGNYAYATDASYDHHGLRIIDVSDPAAPTEVSFHWTAGPAYSVAVAGDFAYVADSWGLRIIDVSDPAAPTRIGSHQTPGSAVAVAVAGDFAYVADSAYDYGALRIIDVSDPAAPIEVGHYTPMTPSGVAVAGDHVYVADGEPGLRIIDVSDPAAPTEIGFYDAPGFAACGVAVVGDYAYVAAYGSGLHIVDISDPAAPDEVGFYDTPEYACGVAVAGNYAYVADQSGGLRIIDVSDPVAPAEAGSYEGMTAWDVAVAGNYAYVANYWAGLSIIDVSDPTAPTEVGFYGTPMFAVGVAVAGDYVYVADGSTLHIVNATNPATPTQTGSCDTPGNARGVAVSGTYAYVADDSGLRIIDVSDPTAPTEVGVYDTPDSAHGVAVSGTYAYVADWPGSLRIVDVSDPAAPIEAGFYSTPGYATGVTVDESYAYVADWDGGLLILRFTAPNQVYSISGHVRDDGGAPLSGVTVSTGGSNAAVTDVTGAYTITDLISGTYTLTPTLSGWTFTPLTRTVSVPPDATGQDFVAQDPFAPQGSITSPAEGATVGPGTVEITADAWDVAGGSGVQRVEFYAKYDGAWHALTSDTEAPYTAQWPVPLSLRSQQVRFGIHVLDNAGNLTMDPGGTRTVSYLESLSPSVTENWVPSRAYLNQRALPDGELKCGAASMAMVLATNGLIDPDSATMSAKANEMYPETLLGGAVFVHKMVDELNDQGAEAAHAAETAEQAWQSLVQEVDAGRPVIVRTAPGIVTTYSHFVVAVGYRQTDATREFIAYDPYGRWQGEENLYDRNTTDPASHKGAWVFYDFRMVFGGHLITARSPAESAQVLTSASVPGTPPDEMSDEAENEGSYTGIVIGERVFLPLTLRNQ